MRCSISKGFSLIELILVVLLLSVIAGLTVPNFKQSFSNLKLNQTAKDLSYVMRYAQSRAVSKGILIRLEFASAMDSYHLTQVSSGEYERFKGRMGRDFQISDLIKINFTEGNLIFFPDGTIEKKEINVCKEERCLLISTKIQRGYVNVIEEK
ncbi:hypothetical protein MNBD_BACTEROID05-137 [hydrothermal vent metagenome]|uniref:General secretion pathway GspH domain-containing protein n=1 Tax=hydrothermal vent metagenome TaxID=652676 RepID=A0A3B0UEI9_9ZZZZ